MFQRMRERFAQFMVGRYGMDHFGRFLVYFSLALMIISLFFPNSIIYWLALVMLIYAYFRMFSRNVQKRYQENCTYYRYINKVKDFFKKQKSYMQQSKTHHIYKCPSCKQKIRVPRGRGKIAIRCRKCGTEFIKKS